MSFIETNKLELKVELSKSVMNTVCAFANAEGGSIIIGVNDSGAIVGIKDAFKIKGILENQINDLVRPRVDYNLCVLDYDGKKVIEVNVFGGSNPPYAVNGVAYVRKDTSTVSADAHQLQELSLRGKNLTFDQLASSKHDLKFDTLAKYLAESKGIESINDGILITLGLKKDNAYNIAAELISDVNQDQLNGIDIARFNSDTTTFVDRISLVGISIIEQFYQTVDYMLTYYGPVEVVSGVTRKIVEQYPIEAFREAIANAIVHRDYSIKANIKVLFYDNRVEIISPGSLPQGVDATNYDTKGYSVLRNQVIAQVFSTIDLIEKFGMGYWKIKNTYLRYGKQPRFIFKEKNVEIILPNLIYKDDNLSDEARLISFLEINGSSSRTDIETYLNISRKRALTLISSMVSKKLLLSQGDGPNRKYTLS